MSTKKKEKKNVRQDLSLVWVKGRLTGKVRVGSIIRVVTVRQSTFNMPTDVVYGREILDMYESYGS